MEYCETQHSITPSYITGGLLTELERCISNPNCLLSEVRHDCHA
jgi:hypothetical protein